MFNDEGLGAAMGLHYTNEKAKQALSETEELKKRVAVLEDMVRLLCEHINKPRI